MFTVAKIPKKKKMKTKKKRREEEERVNGLIVVKIAIYTVNHKNVTFLANVNSSSCSLFVIDGPSVCLSSVCLSSVCNVGAPYSGD